MSSSIGRSVSSVPIAGCSSGELGTGSAGTSAWRGLAQQPTAAPGKCRNTSSEQRVVQAMQKRYLFPLK